MPKPTHLEEGSKGSQLPEQSSLTTDTSSSLKALSLNGERAEATPYGHPLGPHILAPADSKQIETTSRMEADTRGLENARHTSSAEELRSSHSTHTSSEVFPVLSPITISTSNFNHALEV